MTSLSRALIVELSIIGSFSIFNVEVGVLRVMGAVINFGVHILQIMDSISVISFG